MVPPLFECLGADELWAWLTYSCDPCDGSVLAFQFVKKNQTSNGDLSQVMVCEWQSWDLSLTALTTQSLTLVGGELSNPEPQAPPGQLPPLVGPRDRDDQNETQTTMRGCCRPRLPCGGSVHRGWPTLQADLDLALVREPPPVPGQGLSLLTSLREGVEEKGPGRNKGWG